MSDNTEAVDGPYYLEKVLIPEDSDDGYEYEEISIEEESVNGEEDLETVTEVLRNLTNDSFVPKSPPSSKKQSSPIPEVIDDFFRNFLMKMGMIKTLDCFQTEWFEMLQKGMLKTNLAESVPDMFAYNEQVENELKNVQIERDSYKLATFKAGDTIRKLQMERDFHRLQRKCVKQEKKQLYEDIQSLKKHFESYGPALKQVNKKYQAALGQKMLVSIEMDRLITEGHNIEAHTVTHVPTMEHTSLVKGSGDPK